MASANIIKVALRQYFKNVIGSILDDLIPDKTKIGTRQLSQPWFSKEMADTRQHRSQLE